LSAAAWSCRRAAPNKQRLCARCTYDQHPHKPWLDRWQLQRAPPPIACSTGDFVKPCQMCCQLSFVRSCHCQLRNKKNQPPLPTSAANPTWQGQVQNH
jgi:hypothetical protein